MAAGAVVVLGVEVMVARAGPPLPAVHLDLRLAGEGSGTRLVWLGDSTAAGVGASQSAGALPRQVADGLARRGRPVDLEVLAVSGAKVADLRAQARRAAVLRPDVVLVSVGANDTTHLTGRRAFRRTYEEVVRSLPGEARVVLLGVPDMGASPRLTQPLRAVVGWRGERLDADVQRVARTTGAVYADIAGPTGPQFRRHPDRYFAADSYHPNGAGYGLWAEAVLRVMDEAGLPAP